MSHPSIRRIFAWTATPVAMFAGIGLAGSGTAQAGTIAGERPAAVSPATVCYDVADAGGNWLPSTVCNGRLVTPAGGLYGLGVEVSGGTQTPSVEYSAYYNGSWEAGKNGSRVGTIGDPITAVSISISPRRGRNLCYTVVDMSFNQYNQCNGGIAGTIGTTAVPLRAITITYSG